MISSNLLFFSNLFSGDMILIMVVALFLFGGEKLPEVVRALGKGIREFKDASEGIKREINEQINNYDEKRTEASLNKKAQELQNQPSAVESPRLVENTMPVNDNHFAGEQHPANDVHLEQHDAPVAESFESAKHAETNLNELTKNS